MTALKNSLSFPIMLTVNVLAILFTASVFIPTPSGARIRPMGWVSMITTITVASFFLGLILVVFDVMRGKSRGLIYSFLLCVTPLPVAILMFKLFIMAKGFKLSP